MAVGDEEVIAHAVVKIGPELEKDFAKSAQTRANADLAKVKAKILLAADARGFNARAKAALDVEAARANAPTYKVKLVADATGFNAKASAALDSQAALKNAPNYKINLAADTTGFNTRVRAELAKYAATHKQPEYKVKLVADAKGLNTRALGGLVGQANSAQGRITQATRQGSRDRLNLLNREASQTRSIFAKLGRDNPRLVDFGGRGARPFTILIGALVALSPLLVSVASNAVEASTSIAALGSAGIGAGLAISGLVVGFSGLLAALKLRQTTYKQELKLTSDAQKKAAADSAATAKKSVAADATTAAAKRRILDAESSLTNARHTLVRSQRAELKAQQDVNDARRQAIRDLQDLKRAVSDLQNQERGDRLSVTEAKAERDRLQRDFFATDLMRARADQDVNDAITRLKDTQLERKQKTEDLATAMRKGVGGSDKVVAAMDAARNAVENRQQAQRGVDRAKRGLVAARTGKTTRAAATDPAAAAADNASIAANALNDQLRRLSPAARELFHLIDDSQPTWDRLARSIQTMILPGFTEALRHLLRVGKDGKSALDILANAAGRLAGKISDFVEGIGDIFLKPWMRLDIRKMTANNETAFQRLSNAAKALIHPLTTIFTDSQAGFTTLSGGIEKAAEWIARFIEQAHQSGRLQQWFREARREFAKWWDIAKNIAGFFKGVFTASRASGSSVMTQLDNLFRRLSQWANSGRGQAQMTKFFEFFAHLPYGKIAQFALTFSKLLFAYSSIKFAVKNPFWTAIGLFMTANPAGALGVMSALTKFATVGLGAIAAHPAAAGALLALISAAKVGRMLNIGLRIPGIDMLIAKFRPLGDAIRGGSMVTTTMTVRASVVYLSGALTTPGGSTVTTPGGKPVPVPGAPGGPGKAGFGARVASAGGTLLTGGMLTAMSAAVTPSLVDAASGGPGSAGSGKKKWQNAASDAVTGAIAGATIGTVIGPEGTALGALIGGVIGGIGGGAFGYFKGSGSKAPPAAKPNLDAMRQGLQDRADHASDMEGLASDAFSMFLDDKGFGGAKNRAQGSTLLTTLLRRQDQRINDTFQAIRQSGKPGAILNSDEYLKNEKLRQKLDIRNFLAQNTGAKDPAAYAELLQKMMGRGFSVNVLFDKDGALRSLADLKAELDAWAKRHPVGFNATVALGKAQGSEKTAFDDLMRLMPKGFWGPQIPGQNLFQGTGRVSREMVNSQVDNYVQKRKEVVKQLKEETEQAKGPAEAAKVVKRENEKTLDVIARVYQAYGISKQKAQEYAHLVAGMPTAKLNVDSKAGRQAIRDTWTDLDKLTKTKHEVPLWIRPVVGGTPAPGLPKPSVPGTTKLGPLQNSPSGFIDLGTQRRNEIPQATVAQAITPFKLAGQQMGGDLVQGMQDGMTAATPGLDKYLNGWGKDTVDHIKAPLGVKSPSTQTYAIGEDLILGLWNGFTAKWQAIQDGVTKWVTDHIGTPLGDTFTAMGTSLKDAFVSPFDTIVQALAAPVRKAFGWLDTNLINPLNKLLSSLFLPTITPIDAAGPVNVANVQTGLAGQVRAGAGVRRAAGGPVPGYSPNSRADNIPAWLTANEYVQPVDAVQHYGVDFMDAVRTRQYPKYAGGGIVGGIEPAAGRNLATEIMGGALRQAGDLSVAGFADRISSLMFGSFFGGTGDAGVADVAIGTARAMHASAKQMLALIEAGLVESGLRDLNYGDRDSLGFLQQRASWGSAAQRMDVAWATRAFLNKAMRVDSAKLSAGQLAQAVQVSAYPGAYDKRAADALAILNQSARMPVTGGAGGLFGPWPTSPATDHGHDSGVWRRIIGLVASTGLDRHAYGSLFDNRRTDNGNWSWHSDGRAVDFLGFNQDRLAQFFEARKPQVLELIHRSDTRDYGITRGHDADMGHEFALHRNHLHVAMAKGGLVARSYDTGGDLPPGYTLAFNGTGQTETVRTQGQEQALGGGQQPVRLHKQDLITLARYIAGAASPVVSMDGRKVAEVTNRYTYLPPGV